MSAIIGGKKQGGVQFAEQVWKRIARARKNIFHAPDGVGRGQSDRAGKNHEGDQPCQHEAEETAGRKMCVTRPLFCSQRRMGSPAAPVENGHAFLRAAKEKRKGVLTTKRMKPFAEHDRKLHPTFARVKGIFAARQEAVRLV